MNTLLINHYAGNLQLGMEFRPYYLAKKWQEMGHKATIIGASFSHLRQKQPKPGWQVVDKIDYLWLWTNRYQGNGLMRFISMLIFVIQLILLSFYLAWKVKPDAVIASSTYPLDIFPSWIIARLCGAKLVFEIHDLWPLSPMELGKMSKWHPFILLMRFAEKFAYKASDKIVSILPGTFEHVKKDGVKKENFIHIPNGINLEDYDHTKPIPKELQKLIDQEKRKGNKLIGYAGSIGIANALDVLINTAARLRSNKVSFIIIGDGPELKNLQSLARFLQVSNVHFVGRINKLMVPSFLQQMDFLYFGALANPIYKFGISPNKLFDYMMVGKPIIQCISTNGDIVKKAKCGFTALPGNSMHLAKAINQAYKLPKGKLKLMANRAKEYIIKHHDYNILAKKFIQTL